VTPNGVEFEVTEDGCLVIHHGEMVKSCARGRKGVAIIISPQVRKAWKLGGFRSCILQWQWRACVVDYNSTRWSTDMGSGLWGLGARWL